MIFFPSVYFNYLKQMGWEINFLWIRITLCYHWWNLLIYSYLKKTLHQLQKNMHTFFDAHTKWPMVRRSSFNILSVFRFATYGLVFKIIIPKSFAAGEYFFRFLVRDRHFFCFWSMICLLVRRRRNFLSFMLCFVNFALVLKSNIFKKNISPEHLFKLPPEQE